MIALFFTLMISNFVVCQSAPLSLVKCFRMSDNQRKAIKYMQEGVKSCMPILFSTPKKYGHLKTSVSRTSFDSFLNDFDDSSPGPQRSNSMIDSIASAQDELGYSDEANVVDKLTTVYGLNKRIEQMIASDIIRASIDDVGLDYLNDLQEQRNGLADELKPYFECLDIEVSSLERFRDANADAMLLNARLSIERSFDKNDMRDLVNEFQEIGAKVAEAKLVSAIEFMQGSTDSFGAFTCADARRA